MPQYESRRPGQVDGLNAGDSGVGLLARAVENVDPARLLLVCSGPLPGIGPRARRIVLDAREADTQDAGAVPFGRWPSVAHTVDAAVVWPRAHLGKDFTEQCVAIAQQVLRPRGRLLCAVRKRKGADSIAGFMGEVFGNVEVCARSNGYRLLQSVREPGERTRPDILDRRYSFGDSRLGQMRLQSAPGCFSRRALDAGTQCLIDHVTQCDLEPRRVVDLGAGVGPLALWAAQRWPRCGVVAVESNFVSAAMLRHNVRAAGLADRVVAVAHAGLPPGGASVQPSSLGPFLGTTDVTLTNPPTHADAGALADLLAPLSAWHRAGGRTFAVACRPEMVARALQAAGAKVHVTSYSKFSVLEGGW